MKRQGWIAAVALALMLVLTGCASAPEMNLPAEPPSASEPTRSGKGYTDITAEQLQAMLANKDFTLVNVHIPYEGEIPQTDLFIPFNEITRHLDQLPDKGARIVLYCRSGSMSTSAAEDLVEVGYTNVLEVDGGMWAWEAAGYELIRR